MVPASILGWQSRSWTASATLNLLGIDHTVKQTFNCTVYHPRNWAESNQFSQTYGQHRANKVCETALKDMWLYTENKVLSCLVL